MSSEKELEEFPCATPTLELVSNEKTLSKVLQSHTWKVEKAELFGDGFLTKIECVRCGLMRTAIVSNVEDSARKARELREKKQEELVS
jgi:hypothetical protein